MESFPSYVPVTPLQWGTTTLMAGITLAPFANTLPKQTLKIFSAAQRSLSRTEKSLLHITHSLKQPKARGAFLKLPSLAKGETLDTLSHFGQVLSDLKTSFIRSAPTSELQALNLEITSLYSKPGKTYSVRYLDNQRVSKIAEQNGIKTLERAGYKVFDSKLPGNRGIDTVAIKFNTVGKVEDIIVEAHIQDILVVESKYTSTGKAQLNQLKPVKLSDGNTIPVTQMDEVWIKRQIALMKEEENLAQLAELLDSNKFLIRRKVNVTTPHDAHAAGINRWSNKLHKVKLTKPDQFKS